MTGFAAGVDLGGTKIQTIVADADYTVAGQARHATPKDGGPDGVAAAIADSVHEAAAQAGVEVGALRGIGIGSPGSIDSEAGTVARATNVVPEWTEAFPLAAKVQEACGVAVGLGNDVRVGTWGEHVLGAGRPFKSLLGVFWGTGVGGGIILDGRPWTGRGAAGEIGHMVVRRGGALCPCGRHGCVEAYAGRKAMELEARQRVKNGAHTDLFKIMEKHNREWLSSGIWERALKDEDELARHLIVRAIRALGAGIASAVNLLDVEAVIIGGGLGTRLGEPYVERIREAMQPHLFVDDNPPEVVLAELGDLGGALGAALLIDS